MRFNTFLHLFFGISYKLHLVFQTFFLVPWESSKFLFLQYPGNLSQFCTLENLIDNLLPALSGQPWWYSLAASTGPQFSHRFFVPVEEWWCYLFGNIFACYNHFPPDDVFWTSLRECHTRQHQKMHQSQDMTSILSLATRLFLCHGRILDWFDTVCFWQIHDGWRCYTPLCRALP